MADHLESNASKDSPFFCLQDGAALGLDVELLVEVAAVEIDGRLADAERLGDFFPIKAGRELLRGAQCGEAAKGISAGGVRGVFW